MAAPPQPPLKLTSPTSFRQRLIISTLTGRPVTISSIRADSTNPGLLPHEVSFLRLLESITNGSRIEISYTGTTISYRPGLIGHAADPNSASSSKSKVIRHNLPAECSRRGVTYFLEPICLLAPFSRSPLSVVISGAGCVTSATSEDYSIDTLRTAILPLFALFGIERNIECRILTRSAAPNGGGEVHLLFGHQVRLPQTLHLRSQGRVKRIRGVAYCVGVSPGNNARMIDGCRAVLNTFINDIYIYSEVHSAPKPGGGSNNRNSSNKRGSPGFGLSLVASTSTNVLYSADVASAVPSSSPGGSSNRNGDGWEKKKENELPASPEDIGRRCALQLLQEIEVGGCVQRLGLRTVLSLMLMGSPDVGRVVLGKGAIDEGVVSDLRDWRAFTGSEVVVKEWKGSEGFVGGGLGGMDPAELISVGVVGRGIGNVGKKIT